MRASWQSKWPPSVWRFAENVKKRVERPFVSAIRRIVNFFGYNIVRKNYYSPIPILSELKANSSRWNRPSRLTGIPYDLDAFKKTLLHLLHNYYAEFATLPSYADIIQKGFGPGYTELDALILYAMVRDQKPKRYLEVGSGVSSYYCHLAAQQNAREDHPLHIKCIEPYPYKGLYTIPRVEVCVDSVQNTSFSQFQKLEENDILFIDSSHMLKLDGDVPFLYLEVLPNLQKGVLIHIHDIPFPYNVPYPVEYWVLGRTWPMYWNEAMVLQAFLCFNDRFEIELSVPMLRHFDEAFLQQHIPIYKPVNQEPNTFSSIWLRKAR